MFCFACYGEIIQRAARVNESIGLVLHESTWPFKFVSILETVTCNSRILWKLQSCVMSARSMAYELSSLMTKLGPLMAASHAMTLEILVMAHSCSSLRVVCGSQVRVSEVK